MGIHCTSLIKLANNKNTHAQSTSKTIVKKLYLLTEPVLLEIFLKFIVRNLPATFDFTKTKNSANHLRSQFLNF